MAHQDDPTHPDLDDWFDDTHVTENRDTATSSNVQTERRLTVLPNESDDDTFEHDDADWFDSSSTSWTRHDAQMSTDSGSFDAQTALLRGQARRSHPARRTWWQRHRAAAAVVLATSLLIGGVAGVVVLATGNNGGAAGPTPAFDEIVTTTTSAAPTISSQPAAAGTAAANVTWCAGQGPGEPITEDTTDPGLAAIWRFETAFYYDRDGAAARAAGAPDAVMASAARLQLGIDALEPDIEFCVLADRVSFGVYDVTVVERGPGIDGRTAAQRITTAESGGQSLITAITSR